MSFPAHHVGSYTGTAAALDISDCGFRPRFLRIYNDTDNDVVFDYFDGQDSGLAVKTGKPSISNGALDLTFEGSTPAFTGAAPYASETYSVTHVAVPAGNPIYAKLSATGMMRLVCNMANDTADKRIDFSGSMRLKISHDASAASGGFQVYIRESDGALLINNTFFEADQQLRLIGGGLLPVLHDASASTNGVALSYDDATNDRLEATFVGEEDVDMPTSTSGWEVHAPAGTNEEVTGTVTGDSNSSIGEVISEISSQGITLTERGFSLGSNALVNESGKVYRYVALR